MQWREVLTAKAQSGGISKIAVSPRQISEFKSKIQRSGLRPVPVSTLTIKIVSILMGKVDAWIYFPQEGKSANVWDYAATILLLKEFGGKMTSLDGSAMPFGGQKRIRPGFKWSRGILLFIKPWGIIYLRSITIKNNLMPNKIGKWEELSREIAFQKYSRKIEKVMDKISDKKER